jgi:hypothetical protein
MHSSQDPPQDPQVQHTWKTFSRTHQYSLKVKRKVFRQLSTTQPQQIHSVAEGSDHTQRKSLFPIARPTNTSKPSLPPILLEPTSTASSKVEKERRFPTSNSRTPQTDSLGYSAFACIKIRADTWMHLHLESADPGHGDGVAGAS